MAKNIELEKKNTLCFYFDMRVGAEKTEREKLNNWIKANCDQWCYQLEKGEKSDYLHYQCRIKMKTRCTPNMIAKSLLKEISMNHSGLYIAQTSNENKKNYFYVSKEESRIDGPWSNLDTENDKVEIYIPKRFRGLESRLYPYQKFIFDSAEKIADDRTINVLYSPNGCEGKSTISSFCHVLGKGIELFPRNDAEKIIEDLCDILMKKNCREPGLIFIDLPRAMKKEKLYGMLSAIEMIKKGFACDRRYEYKEWWFEPPHIWVFSNFLFDEKLLSKDRWKIWIINEDRELERYSEEKAQVKEIKEHLRKCEEDRDITLRGAPTPPGSSQKKKKKLTDSNKVSVILEKSSDDDDIFEGMYTDKSIL